MTVSELICKIYWDWCTFIYEVFTERRSSFDTKKWRSGFLVTAILIAVEISDGVLVFRNEGLEAEWGFLNMWLRNWPID